MQKASVILLAGGLGTRMGAQLPKQYLPLGHKTLVLHCFDTLLADPQVAEVIVVCSRDRQALFAASGPTPIAFADPGERRQDSVFSGLQKVDASSEIIAVHDGARPFVPPLAPLIEAAQAIGAATFALPLAFTVKEADAHMLVAHTLRREKLYEIQTPQAARRALLQEGFHVARKLGLTVTDDVSLIELIGGPVKLVPGARDNIKVTHPEDVTLATLLLAGREVSA